MSPVTDASTAERELIRRMLAGEEAAFQAFFNDQFRRVYRFALPRLNGDPDATQEVVQATLVKAIRQLPQFRGEAALFTWVCQICRNEVVDWLRAHARQAERTVLVEDSAELRAVFEGIAAPAEEEPARQYSAAEVRRLVQGVLDQLPAGYGDALEWKYIDGLSVDEIGARLGITTVAAQSLLARARPAFRAALEAVFGAEARDILGALHA